MPKPPPTLLPLGENEPPPAPGRAYPVGVADPIPLKPKSSPTSPSISGPREIPVPKGNVHQNNVKINRFD